MTIKQLETMEFEKFSGNLQAYAVDTLSVKRAMGDLSPLEIYLLRALNANGIKLGNGLPIENENRNDVDPPHPAGENTPPPNQGDGRAKDLDYALAMKFPMGKHKGERLEVVPNGYIEWCLKQSWFLEHENNDIAAIRLVMAHRKEKGIEIKGDYDK